ncbi:hypothetical protein KCU91_g37, partial [Aureobasidium melanogenum]
MAGSFLGSKSSDAKSWKYYKLRVCSKQKYCRNLRPANIRIHDVDHGISARLDSLCGDCESAQHMRTKIETADHRPLLLSSHGYTLAFELRGECGWHELTCVVIAKLVGAADIASVVLRCLNTRVKLWIKEAQEPRDKEVLADLTSSRHVVGTIAPRIQI